MRGGDVEVTTGIGSVSGCGGGGCRVRVVVVVEAGVCGRGWPCNRSGVGLVVVGGRSG